MGHEIMDAHHKIAFNDVYSRRRRNSGRRPTFRPEHLRRPALAFDRPLPRRPDEGRRRRAEPAQRFLYRSLQRRRVEDDRLRPDLVPHLRRSADRFDRGDRRGPLRSEHHLRWDRRRPAAARPLGRRRPVQIHRRGQDVDAPRPARRPADPPDYRRPEQSRPAVRRRARPSLRPERGARHFPFD